MVSTHSRTIDKEERDTYGTRRSGVRGTKEDVKERYLGSVGHTAGRFDWKKQKDLTPGEGKIKLG